MDRVVLEKIVNAGRLGPTARNEQPREFVVVTKQETLKRIAGMIENGRFIGEAPVCVLVLCRETRYYLEDGSVAATNMVNAAAELGVQSCWVAGDKKDYAAAVMELIKAPVGMKLVALLAMGYAAGVGSRKTKRPLQEVLHWEEY